MKFKELLNDPFLRTPKNLIYKEHFFEYVEENLSSYRQKIEKLGSEDIKIKHVKYNPPFIKEIVKILINGLLECLEFYYDGKINKAYNKLHETLTHDRKSFYDILKQSDIPTGTDFYRIRVRHENYLFEPKEMFHIPYESRGCVKNQRFSINGFPSLYVSSNLYTCWEELKRPDLNNFQAIRFSNTTPVSMLDLTPPTISEEITREHYRYLITWPIIFICSIKVANDKDTFKPEYIIPQLLLQWIRQNDEIDCIRYLSTNIEIYNSKSIGDFSNYVFPVKESNKTGFCGELMNMFQHSDPISWQAFQYSTGGQEFLYLENEFTSINKKIPKLEIIKGRPYPYSFSILGRLEHSLNTFKLHPTNF